jgi:hypothetical protein
MANLTDPREIWESRFSLARLNSIHDTNYGAVGHQEVERNCFLVQGMLKRFFDRQDLDRLFQAGWQVHSCREHVVHCCSKPKTVWEVVVEKA